MSNTLKIVLVILGITLVLLFMVAGKLISGYNQVIANKIASEAGVKISGMPAVQKKSTVKKRKPASGPLGKFLSLAFFLILVIVFIKNPRVFLTFLLFSSMGGRRGHWGGSGGGFGGGGFGGGGGGFGGGGATGGW